MQRHDLPVTRRGDLTDGQWNRIYPYLPVSRKGRPFDNVRDTVMVFSGFCGRVLRGGTCRLFMETGIPYTNVLPNGKRQVYLNPYSKSFPKMPTCRM